MGTLPITQAIIRGLFLAAATGDPRTPRLFTERPQDGSVNLLVNTLTWSPLCCPESSARSQRLGGWTRQFRST